MILNDGSYKNLHLVQSPLETIGTGGMIWNIFSTAQ